MRVIALEVLDGPSMGALASEFIDVATLAGAISAFVPIAVAFITKKEASDRVKAIVNLLAVAAASVIALFVNGNNGEPITWSLVAATFMTGLVTSIVAYKAGWKPVGVTPAIANATRNLGFGTPTPRVAHFDRPANGDGGAQ